MRYRKPMQDWERCTNCGKFTGTLTEGCPDCGNVEQQSAGGWVSDYYK